MLLPEGEACGRCWWLRWRWFEIAGTCAGAAELDELVVAHQLIAWMSLLLNDVLGKMGGAVVDWLELGLLLQQVCRLETLIRRDVWRRALDGSAEVKPDPRARRYLVLRGVELRLLHLKPLIPSLLRVIVLIILNLTLNIAEYIFKFVEVRRIRSDIEPFLHQVWSATILRSLRDWPNNMLILLHESSLL